MNNAVSRTSGLGAAVIAAATMPATAIDTPPTWNPPVVVDTVPNYFLDFAAYEGQSRYLAYDHFGEPGIAYSNSGFTHYARPIAGLGWVDEVVDDPDVYSVLSQPSLAYGLDEMPHLSWSGAIIAPFVAVYHAAFDGLQWDIDFFAFGDFVAPGRLTSSLSIDLLGRPGIAYSIDGSLLYRYDTDGDGLMLGEPDCLINSASAPIESSTASDSLGQAMVALSNNGQLIFSARPLGHECFSTDIITVGARYPSLAIDPDTNYPAIAYYDFIDGDLIFAAWDGTQWVLTPVDTTNNTGLYPSLAFDPADGNPAIAYQDISDGDLKLAWHDGANWNTQVVVDGTIKVPAGYTPSLAFNEFGTGFPAIAYFSIDSNLYFVEDPPLTGDINGDGVVNINDMLLLLANWT